MLNAQIPGLALIDCTIIKKITGLRPRTESFAHYVHRLQNYALAQNHRLQTYALAQNHLHTMCIDFRPMLSHRIDHTITKKITGLRPRANRIAEVWHTLKQTSAFDQ